MVQTIMSSSLTERLEHDFKVNRPTVERSFPYGTAGFRSLGNDMRHVMHRSGLLAALFSRITNHKVTGICITGSHNPAQDNGVKFISSEGVIDEEFEEYAAEFVNSKDPLERFIRFCRDFDIDIMHDPQVFSKCRVYCGRDTRESSPALLGYVKAGIESLGAQFIDMGVVTTPQAHFAVQIANQRPLQESSSISLDDYYQYFSQHFSTFIELCGLRMHRSSSHGLERVVCDGANGVGAIRIVPFTQMLKDCINVELEVRNDGSRPDDVLNSHCGTEYVQKQMLPPNRFGPSVHDPMYLRCCSLDGDADRILYHTTDASGHLVMLDGDKIGCLYGKAIAKLLGELIHSCPDIPDKPLRLASVQTAYANGASTRFYEDLASYIVATCHNQVFLDVCCVKTGVKNLHRRALDFDLAIYFESNGHGTVMVKMERLEAWAKRRNVYETMAFRRLCSFLAIFNQAAGDAMVDVLAVEAALKYLEMSFTDWIQLYSKNPCIQRTVQMPRCSLSRLYPNLEHEKYLEKPLELQKRIDAVRSRYGPDARAFIRPSGTEDVCRLYAEVQTTVHDAKDLCDAIEHELRQFVVMLEDSDEAVAQMEN